MREGKKKRRSRPEIAEGVFGPALTTGMHEETASIPLVDRWFQGSVELSDPHVGPANRPSPPLAILSLRATTVAHTEQPQIHNPTEEKYETNCSFWGEGGVGRDELLVVLFCLLFCHSLGFCKPLIVGA